MEGIVQHQLKRAVFGGSSATLIDLQVAEPLEQLRTALGKVYADKPLKVALAIAPGAAYPIDAGDFLELAGNLMDNACKYCRQSVLVRATPWTAAEWRRPGLVLEVEDDGSGIPPAERARVLERGARADESVAGQGIGLAVAREIAAAYSGTLEIGESRLGGARLRLTIYPPLALSRTGDREADVRSAMTDVNAILERWIRERPEQWLWLHRRWPD